MNCDTGNSEGEHPRRKLHVLSGLIGVLGGAALVLWILVFAGLLEGGMGTIGQILTPTEVVVRIISPTIEITNSESEILDLRAVAAKTVPTVVTVHTTRGSTAPGDSPSQIVGSGVLLDVEGVTYIATNAHVLIKGTAWSVVLSDGRTYESMIVGIDTVTDIGVLSISANNVNTIVVGSSDDLTIGDPVAAIGNPFGLEGGPTVTEGSLSATGRRIEVEGPVTLVGMLQSDAAISEGSSGGALVNNAGELVGITTAITDNGNVGLGFAVPVETTMRAVRDIVKYGWATQPCLRLTVGTRIVKLEDGGVLPIGAEVIAGTTGERRDIKAGELIVAINGYSVQSSDMLLDRLGRYPVDTAIRLTIRTPEGARQIVESNLVACS